MTEIWLALAAGLAAAPHCAGMCGPLVSALSLRAGATGNAVAAFPLMYNLGRSCTYTMLGLTAGLAGSAVPAAAGGWLRSVAHLAVALSGVSMFRGSFGRTGEAPPLPSCAPSRGKPLLLGMLFGFLPCGVVYTFLLSAAASGSPWKGGGIMAALALGSSPVLFLVGSAGGFLGGRGRRLLQVAGVVVAVGGALLLCRSIQGVFQW
ncbi:MAG TPA: sulfite exporter TauE/SafE family protein [Verrucomicrobiae bacterium]|nr:sulfite exporter TauE/SafE family protein [Verrucomicrobiae bacterium]